MRTVWLRLGDYAYSACVVAPLVIMFWRSMWELWAFHHIKHKTDLWPWLGIALSVNVLSCYCPTPKNPHPMVLYIHIYITKVFGVLGWFTSWFIVDRYITKKNLPNLISACVALGLLVFLRCVRNVNSQPYAVSMDSNHEEVFQGKTYFNTKVDSKIKKRASSFMYLIDCLFSVCIIGTLVVFVWRGCWTLLDNHLFPTNPLHSSLASTVIGYIIVFISFSSQELVKGFVRNLSGLPRLVLVDIYLLFSFCGTINVWRGIWSSLNLYFLPHDLMISCLICHVVSFLMLVLLNSSNSVLVRGVYIDAEEEGDTCIDFPCYYLRLILQDKIKKKLTDKRGSVEEGLKDNLMETNKKIQIVSSNGAPEQNKLPEANTLLSQPQ